jgi:hypothetical protein
LEKLTPRPGETVMEYDVSFLTFFPWTLFQTVRMYVKYMFSLPQRRRMLFENAHADLQLRKNMIALQVEAYNSSLKTHAMSLAFANVCRKRVFLKTVPKLELGECIVRITPIFFINDLDRLHR